MNQIMQNQPPDPEEAYFQHLEALGVFGRGSKDNEDFEKIKVKRKAARK